MGARLLQPRRTLGGAKKSKLRESEKEWLMLGCNLLDIIDGPPRLKMLPKLYREHRAELWKLWKGGYYYAGRRPWFWYVYERKLDPTPCLGRWADEFEYLNALGELKQDEIDAYHDLRELLHMRANDPDALAERKAVEEALRKLKGGKE